MRRNRVLWSAGQSTDSVVDIAARGDVGTTSVDTLVVTTMVLVVTDGANVVVVIIVAAIVAHEIAAVGSK